MTERITTNPQQCGGKPCIRGMRIRVADILELYAAGLSSEQILADLPDLEAADLVAVRRWSGKNLPSPQSTAEHGCHTAYTCSKPTKAGR